MWNQNVKFRVKLFSFHLSSNPWSLHRSIYLLMNKAIPWHHAHPHRVRCTLVFLIGKLSAWLIIGSIFLLSYFFPLITTIDYIENSNTFSLSSICDQKKAPPRLFKDYRNAVGYRSQISQLSPRVQEFRNYLISAMFLPTWLLRTITPGLVFWLALWVMQCSLSQLRSMYIHE